MVRKDCATGKFTVYLSQPRVAPKWPRNVNIVDLARLQARATEPTRSFKDGATMKESWRELKELLPILQNEPAPLRCRNRKTKVC